MALRDGGEFRFADGREAALRHHVTDGLLQHIVDERAEDRRVKTMPASTVRILAHIAGNIDIYRPKIYQASRLKGGSQRRKGAHTRRIKR